MSPLNVIISWSIQANCWHHLANNGGFYCGLQLFVSDGGSLDGRRSRWWSQVARPLLACLLVAPNHLTVLRWVTCCRYSLIRRTCSPTRARNSSTLHNWLTTSTVIMNLQHPLCTQGLSKLVQGLYWLKYLSNQNTVHILIQKLLITFCFSYHYVCCI